MTAGTIAAAASETGDARQDEKAVIASMITKVKSRERLKNWRFCIVACCLFDKKTKNLQCLFVLVPFCMQIKYPANRFLSPFLSFFFFFSLSFIFPFMAVHKTSLASQNFATETADAINQQIQVEQQAQHTYLACAAYFGRDDVALPVRFKLLATTRSF